MVFVDKELVFWLFLPLVVISCWLALSHLSHHISELGRINDFLYLRGVTAKYFSWEKSYFNHKLHGVVFKEILSNLKSIYNFSTEDTQSFKELQSLVFVVYSRSLQTEETTQKKQFCEQHFNIILSIERSFQKTPLVFHHYVRHSDNYRYISGYLLHTVFWSFEKQLTQLLQQVKDSHYHCRFDWPPLLTLQQEKRFLPNRAVSFMYVNHNVNADLCLACIV